MKVIKNIPSYNKVLPRVAEETGVTLIDCNNQVKSGVYDDGIHFKKDFYKHWLNEMERQVVGGAISSSGSNYGVKTIEEVAKELKIDSSTKRAFIVKWAGIEGLSTDEIFSSEDE